jgi:hypothetical protein
MLSSAVRRGRDQRALHVRRGHIWTFASGRYPLLEVVATAPLDVNPQTLFEFGLQRMLDGTAALLTPT